MRSAYRVLAFLVAGLVVVQAAAIAYAVAGLGKWVQDGNTFDKAAFESDDTSFDGIVGFMIHGMNGMMLIPLVALILLIVSFFAKVPGGVARAGLVLGLVILQVALGLFGHEIPALGGLHGLNALILFGAAVMTGVRAKEPVVATAPQSAEHRTHV
jgi:hypothetical protein